MVIWVVPLAVMLALALAQWLHARRVRRIGWLAFAQSGRPSPLAKLDGPLRVLAGGAVAWGLIVLLLLETGNEQFSPLASQKPPTQHVVLALDVSPSMHIEDAGPIGKQPRGDRAREVLRSALSRLSFQQTRVTIVAFYSTARPIVIDAADPEVVENILSDLPLEHAFTAGKTNMYSFVESATQIARHWTSGSATLLAVTDGDTLPPSAAPQLSAAYADVLVLGVGSPHRSTAIGDHHSRQNRQELTRLALKLRGQYFDVNSQHIPTRALSGLATRSPTMGSGATDQRQLAIAAVLAGSLVLAVLPLALTLFGGARSRVVRRRTETPSPTALANGRRQLSMAHVMIGRTQHD